MIIMCLAGLHPAGGAEEAAAGPGCVFLHAHQGGQSQTHTRFYVPAQVTLLH